MLGVDTDYMQDGRVFSEYRAGGTSPAGTVLGERQAEAALGLRNLWTAGRRRARQHQRRARQGASGATATTRRLP